MSPAPVALFVYSRPEHTQRTVEALRSNALAATTELHVFSDGAKASEMTGPVAQVRAYTRRIEGFKAVTLHERKDNLGLANSIIKGVTELCETHGRVIVIEDDLLVAARFLEYMNQALERYRDDRLVMQVSGYTFPIDLGGEADAFFLPFTTSWGWATWERAWKSFDPTMRAFERLASDASLRKEFNLGGAYDYFDLLRRQRRGEIDSWAIRWYLSVFMQRGLTLYPARTLVQNIGFDGSGTHCGDRDFEQSTLARDFTVRRFPERTYVHPEWRKIVTALPQKAGAIQNMLRWVRRLLPRRSAP